VTGSQATAPGAQARRLLLPSVVVAAVVAVSVALRIPLLWGLQIDYDEGVYWESLRSMAAGHPLFSSVYSSQPPGFLVAMAPFFAAGHTIAAARAGVLLFFAVALVATYVASRTLLGERAAVVAVLLLAVDPLMLRQSLALQADGPATALGLVAVALAASATRSTGRRAAARSALAGAALSAALLVKLLAVAFAVPVVLVLFLSPGIPWPPLRQALRRGASLLGGVVVAAVALLLPFAERLRLVWSQAISGHLAARSLHEGGFTHDMAVALGRESPFYLAGVVGLVVLLRRAPRFGAVALGWGAAAAALALVQHPLWPHHLVIASPLVAIAAGGVAGMSWRAGSQRAQRRIAAGAVACLAATGLVVGLRALDQPFTADTVRQAVAVLQQQTRPGDVVFTDDQWAVAAADRDTPPELVDTSFVRLDSEGLDAAGIEAILVRSHVAAVYTGTGRLPHIDGLLAWVRVHYPHVTVIRSDAILYTRS
jgi:hypothetical protein